MNPLIKKMVENAIIAAIYVVLTLVTFPISFLGIQFRVAEFLVLLCFFRKDYAFGLTLGCVIANTFSSIGFIDCLFGGLATLLSCLLIGFNKFLIASIFIPVLINGFVVGLELNIFLQEDLLISILLVSLGELVVMIFSYAIFHFIGKKDWFLNLINADQNRNWKI